MAVWERRLGRGACAAGAVAGIAYLSWRVSWSLAGASPWVSIPALAVDLVGLVAVLLLTWALWARPESQSTPMPPAAPALTSDGLDEPLPAVSVMVTSAGRDLPWLRATVLAARPLGPITVVDLAGRDDVRAFAVDHGLDYLATEPDDLNGVGAFADACPTPWFLQLDAGDVPHPEIVARLGPHLLAADAADVAIVQAVAAAASDDSAEHTQTGRHVRDAERVAVNPALGTRGVAMYLGSGALVRADAIRSIDPGTSSPPMAQAAVTASLFAAGHRIVVPGTEPLVAVEPLLVANDAEIVHACEASAARSLLVGEHGALRVNSLSLDQRLAMLTWAIRPLSGVRRTVIVYLVVHALLSGRLPFEISLPAIAALWAPWFVLSACGLFLLSGRTLHPGDRSRGSFRALGTSWRGMCTPNGRPEQPRRIVGGAFGLHHSVAPTAAVTVISIVLGLRGLSDRFTHTLARIDGREMAALLVVSLWSLWSALDALRLLARRTQSRRARRVTASLPCTMLDHGALIVDLTALGAGVLSDVEAHTGDLLRLDVVLPTPSGVTSARIPATVRNIRLDFSGGHRLGVQFGEVDAYVADTLAEYCIVQPGLEVLGTAPPIDRSDVRPVIVVDAEPGGPRRLGLRAAALIAVAGALASAAPRSAEASISEETVRGSVVVRSGDGAPSAAVAGAVALAVCAADPGADATFGTTDDDYLSPRTAVSGADGAYDVVAAGAACWVSVALPSGRLVQRAAGELSSRSDIEVVDMTTGDAPAVETTRAAGVNAGEAQPANIVVTDRVYADLDGNGLDAGADVGLGGVTVTLYSSTGAVVGRTTTADDGTYRAELPADITYRVGLSELPEGWRTEQPDGLSSIRRADASDAPGVGIGLEAAPSVSSLAALAAPLPVGTRLFPAPDAADLAESSSTGIPNGVAALIVAVAALLAVSVLVGSLVPFRRREPGLGAEWGDGWSDGGPWSGGDWSGGGVGAGDQSSADLAIR